MVIFRDFLAISNFFKTEKTCIRLLLQDIMLSSFFDDQCAQWNKITCVVSLITILKPYVTFMLYLHIQKTNGSKWYLFQDVASNARNKAAEGADIDG